MPSKLELGIGLVIFSRSFFIVLSILPVALVTVEPVNNLSPGGTFLVILHAENKHTANSNGTMVLMQVCLFFIVNFFRFSSSAY